MPVYEYTAINAKGKTVSGIIDADGEMAAREKLRAEKIFPASITEAYDEKGKKGRLHSRGIRLFSGIKAGELTMMTRQLSTLVGSGFPLVSAIYALIPQAGSPALKRVLSRLKDAIEEGNSFADALSNFPDVFSPVYINMVRAGEASGTLEIVLERLAEINENQQKQRNQIKSILAYPAIMTLLGGGILFFLLTYIVPQLTSIFSDMGQALPAPTRFIIAASDFLKAYWWLLMIGLVIIYVSVKRIRKTPRGVYTTDRFLLFLPGIGTLARKIAVARFSGTLGSLLENGIPMLTAMDIVKNIAGNVLIADAIKEASDKVEKGMGLGVSLEETEQFPHLSVQMIKVGEQSGDLEDMLKRTADVFENEVESALVGLTSLLEPLIVVLMGVVIGFIVLAIILPIFEINQLVG
ncbi:MAG: type II secretion system inner membrane protein GspF [Thermodesulfobacteriota bacterium]|nr:type II secretion system inner membrane protein GspF [Thermodesulfobacteriota bacterium]